MKLHAVLLAIFVATTATAQDKKIVVIPHAQDRPPGPPLSPQEAIKKMQVPPGFHVELVAAEPDIVNPVAMTFDERGRIWITESIEYPRHSAGPGKDRVKVLESTKGDGKFDKITTVIDGLNIPSGIAIGHGGVWLANAPDILFYPFEDFAGAKLGKPQVVVTGFGRYDTHELPNSLTWGPDGSLYGLNGVFNRSVIKQDGKTFDFTCALFRIHPKTKKFEIFCEGTSNPWGLAFNDNGDAFVSACVIDHLWHLTETGYYHRQGGPYPPYTWKIGSIVKHRHQKAAYCGLVWFDSDAYPPEYREKLYMGNIHGGCINCDQLHKDGSTYFATPGLIAPPLARRASEGAGDLSLPRLRVGLTDAGEKGKALGVGPGGDFLVANDAWFMPVAQKVGPDGCMYILDWYDRYHCYQDANRDPAGIDRLRGRLYRVVYKDYKPAGKIDLSTGTSKEMPGWLASPNIYFRETAQRVLTEIRMKMSFEESAFEFANWDSRRRFSLKETGNNRNALLRDTRAFMSAYSTHGSQFMIGLMDDEDPSIRALGVRAAGSMRVPNKYEEKVREKAMALAKDEVRDVQLQVAIAARKLKGVDPLPILFDVLTHCGDDKLIPHIVWQNLHPLLEKDGERFLGLAAKADLAKAPGLAKVLPRAIDRILGNASGDPAAVVRFVEKLAQADPASATAKMSLTALSIKVQNGEIGPKQFDAFRGAILPFVHSAIKDNAPLALEAAVLGAALKDDKAIGRLRQYWGATEQYEGPMLTALDALTAAGDASILNSVGAGLADPKTGSPQGRARMLAALARLQDAKVAAVVLAAYPTMEPELKPNAIELLTQRPSWAKSLFQKIAAKKIGKDVVNVNQARRLLATKDKELAGLIEKHWGVPRDSRSPERERIVAQMKELYKKTPGDPMEGKNVFKRVCMQCHKIYGGGPDVGPDLTSNGRSDFDQLLSNIFDPSLVIGAGYQAVVVNTKQGMVITGLVVEDNAQRVVLKVQGGELKTVSRADVESQFTSKLSMMPEDLEKQLRPQEIADLLEYLVLDRPPDDPKARKIPGTPR